MSLETSECQTPGLISSPLVLATVSCGDHPVPRADRGPPEGGEWAGVGGQPQPQAPAKGNSIGSVLVWAARHLHKDLLQPGPAGAEGHSTPRPDTPGSHLQRWGEGLTPDLPTTLLSWVPAKASQTRSVSAPADPKYQAQSEPWGTPQRATGAE